MTSSKPILSLFGRVSGIAVDSMYPNKEFENDAYWSGGTTPRAYRWEFIISVDPQQHSSPDTRTPRVYNGLDVFTGMWIGDTAGNSLKITKVTSKSATQITVIAEDVDRVNTFKDSSGNGNGSLVSGSEIVIFDLDDESLPVISRLPDALIIAGVSERLRSRFQRWNPNRRYRISKLNHDFKVNDVVVANSTSHAIEKFTTANSTAPVIGTVIEVYKNWFYISPINRILEHIQPSIEGNVGDYIYVDPETGEYTTTPTSKRVFLKLTNAVPTSVTSKDTASGIVVGNEFIINDARLTVESTSPNDLVALINDQTSNHKVIASAVAGETVAIPNINEFGYGVVGAILPLSFKINGHTVNLTTTASGEMVYGAGMADHHDMVADINAANIPNIRAEATSGDFRLYDSSGGTITIENLGSDGGGMNFAGPSSCTGHNLVTVPSGNSMKITLTRNDGGAITIEDKVGQTLENIGLFSVQNGQAPACMIVENWNRVTQTFVVDNLTARNALQPVFVGDSVLVLDKGNGEWGQYMFTGSEYILTATQDSARTDADVLSTVIEFDDENSVATIGALSDGSRVINVTIEVLEPFNQDAYMSIGDVDDHSRLVPDSVIDLSVVGKYSHTPSHVYETGGDVIVKAFYDFEGSESGRLKVVLSYS